MKLMTKLNKQIAGYDVFVTNGGEFVVDTDARRFVAASLPALKKKVEAWQQEQAAPEPPVVPVIYYYQTSGPRPAWIVGSRTEKQRNRSDRQILLVKYDSLDSPARDSYASAFIPYSDEMWERLKAVYAAHRAAESAVNDLIGEAETFGYDEYQRAALSPAEAAGEHNGQ
jgi:hypothetical protein